MGYTADSLRYEQKLTQHCKNYIPIKHLKIVLIMTIFIFTVLLLFFIKNYY